MEKVAPPGIFPHDLDLPAPHLADLAHHHHLAIAVAQRPHPPQHVQVPGLGLLADVVLRLVGIAGEHGPARPRIVAQPAVMDKEIDRIQPEPVHPPVKPEAHRAKDGVHRRLAVKVDVGLFGQKVVQVILPPPRIELPCAAAKDRQPVVRRRAIGPGIGPDIPIGPGIVARRPALGKPRVTVRGMAHHLVDDDPEPQLMRPRHHAVEIVKRAEDRIDPGIVRDVIAHVPVGRGEEG